jgi:hypothetical protein
MQTVSERFRAEQLKPKSAGSRWDIKASADGELRDLTPFLKRETLARLEWRIENEMALFTTPDFQFELWYDADLWSWLNDHDSIIVDVKCGFHFEKIQRFWGYVDKDNLKKESTGTIYVRVYGFIEYLNSINTTDVFGSPASPSYYRPLRDVVQDIFDYLELTNQTIQVESIDTYPNAETMVLSMLAASPMTYTGTCHICRVSSTKFYFINSMSLWFIEFTDDFSDFTVIDLGDEWSAGNKPIDIFKWEDDKYAIIVGDHTMFSYKNGASWTPAFDYQATEILFYDGAGTYLGTTTLSTFIVGSYIYIPMATGIRKFDNLDRYAILYNVAQTSQPKKIESCMVRIRNSDTHATVTDLTFSDYYKHPKSESCTGYWYNHDNYYFTLLCPNSGYTSDVQCCKIHSLKDSWYIALADAGYNATELAGRQDTLGYYVCFNGFRDAYKVDGMSWESNFWTYANGSVSNDYLGRSVRQTANDDVYQIITYYNHYHHYIEIKSIDTAHTVTTEGITTYDPGSSSVYFLPKVGFTYWRTYKDKHSVLGMIVPGGNEVFHIGMYSNQIYPYVKQPPLSETETLADTIKDLAIAGCCIFNFPDNETGVFMLRRHWDDDMLYVIPAAQIYTEWQVTKKLPRRIIVTSGLMKVEVGEGDRTMNINSDYIPDHDDAIGQAYGYLYYDYVNNNPYVIEMNTDFLIQHEIFDQVQTFGREGSESYKGRIMKSVQEGNRVSLEIQGSKVT